MGHERSFTEGDGWRISRGDDRGGHGDMHWDGSAGEEDDDDEGGEHGSDRRGSHGAGERGEVSLRLSAPNNARRPS